MKREEIGELLSHVLDLERLVTKIVYGTANAKDLRAVSSTAAVLPELKRLLEDSTSEELSRIWRELDTLEDICGEIDRAICEEPPFTVRDGGMIADGYDPEVDRLRSIMKNGQSWGEKVAAEEKERTGIKNLKIGYNKVFGYYIEVTNATSPTHETSVDGTHPGDYGYTLWAESLQKPLLKILKKYGIR
mgnify:CR=1 FL=1